MTKMPEQISNADTGLVLSALEPDQLAAAKNVLVPRRKLAGAELTVLWALRIYVLFMLAVVFWQAWSAAR